MFDPIYECYSVKALPPYVGDDARQYVFGYSQDDALLEAVELCQREGREYVGMTLVSAHPMFYWTNEVGED